MSVDERLVIDAFGGPGGASEGMRQLGIDSIGIEWDGAACATRAAAGHRTIRADVATFPLDHLPPVWGLWMSPPCPTFSTTGKGEGRDELAYLHAFTERVWKQGWHDPLAFHAWTDPRTPLVLEPLRWVETLRPEWVCLEQVPPVLELWESYCAVWQDAGYSVWCGVLNAADYGVPQTRKRAILMASRSTIVEPPAATHALDPQPEMFGPQREPWVSMAAALGWGMGERPYFTIPTAGGKRGGADEQVGGSGARRQLYAERDSDRWVVRTGANTMKHGRSEADVEPYERDVTEAPAPTLDSKAGSAWVLDRRQAGAPPLDTSRVPSPTLTSAAVGKGVWTLTRPATTVCGTDRLGEPGHRDRDSGEPQFASDAIRLTEAEGSVLQGFPPAYPWQGVKSKRWQQIGNAVPPPLARAVVSAVVG